MFSEIWSVMDYVRCSLIQCRLRLIAASGTGACRSNPPRSIRDCAQREGLPILGKTQKKLMFSYFQLWEKHESRKHLSKPECESKYYVWSGVPAIGHLHWGGHDLAMPHNKMSNWILIREQSVISHLLLNTHNIQQLWHLCKQSNKLTRAPVGPTHPFEQLQI